MESYFNMLNLFASSLKTMEFRGYETEQFDHIIDVYDIYVEYRTLNTELPEQYKGFTVEGLIMEIQNINKSKFNVVTSTNLSNYKESISYIVQNYTTGMRTLVYFLPSKKNKLNSDEFSKAVLIVRDLKYTLNGNVNLQDKFTFVNALFIIPGKLGPTPNEKNSVINSIDFIDEDMILCRPYDNVFQSQYHVMSKSEEKSLFSTPSVKKNLIPSIKLHSDLFMKFANIKEGSVVEMVRSEFEEQALDTSIYYRYVK